MSTVAGDLDQLGTGFWINYVRKGRLIEFICDFCNLVLRTALSDPRHFPAVELRIDGALGRVLTSAASRQRKETAMQLNAEPETRAAAGAIGAASLGDLPEWNLADLYPGMDAPELKSDLRGRPSKAVAFEKRWKGTLAAEAASRRRRPARRRR